MNLFKRLSFLFQKKSNKYESRPDGELPKGGYSATCLDFVKDEELFDILKGCTSYKLIRPQPRDISLDDRLVVCLELVRRLYQDKMEQKK